MPKPWLLMKRSLENKERENKLNREIDNRLNKQSQIPEGQYHYKSYGSYIEASIRSLKQIPCAESTEGNGPAFPSSHQRKEVHALKSYVN